MNLDKYETIILDCDGVILDSNTLKLEAFRNALKEYDKYLVNDFIEYFKNNFGTSRYNLTKVFIEEFLKIDFNESIYKEILNNYSLNCVILYEKALFTINFLNFMKRYKNKNFFVASGSDQEELRTVFRKRKLDNFFVEIYGSPAKKSDIVKSITKTNKNAIMIGDAKSDLIAAEESGIDFIFMKDYTTNENMKNDLSLNSIKNLGDLI